MDLQFLIWLVVEGVLFILSMPFNRKIISERENRIGNRQINVERRFKDVISIICKDTFLFMVLTIICIVIIAQIPANVIKIMLTICSLVVGSFLSIAISWIVKNKNTHGIFWYIMEFIIFILLAALSNVINNGSEKIFNNYYYIIELLIALLFSVLFIILLNAFSNKVIFPKRVKIEKNIRTDLYYRTTNIKVNKSEIELVRYCEQFFDRYRNVLEKTKEIKRVEFVTLVDDYHEYWYNSVRNNTKIFVIVNIIFLAISIFCKFSYFKITTLFIICVFLINVRFLKKNDLMCLYKIVVRYFYDDWGYHIYYSNGKSKYVGDIPFFETGKHHKYIRSFLDVVALGRAIMTYDKLEKTCRIKILSNNFAELFNDYGKNIDKEKSWAVMLPLWALSWFEYDVCGEIGKKTRDVLCNTLSTKEEWVEVSMFLQSFHAYITRKELNSDGCKLLCGYMENLKGENN